MKKSTCLTLALLVFFSAETGFAQKKTTFPEAPPTLEEIVVTATRYEEKVSTVPANVSVISREIISNSTARDVPGLLRMHSGVHVTDVTGNGRSFRVDLRGFGETAQSNTLVLVDGRRVNQADLSGTDWTLIPLDRVERIEIIRGARGSVLYGDNAAGGVINIITRQGERFRAGADAGVGSFDTYRGNGYVNGSRSDFSYDLSARYYKSDGYRDNSRTRAEDLGANFSYLMGELAKLSLSGGYHKDETGLPGALRQSELEAFIPRRATLHPEDFADTDDYYVKLKPEVFLTDDSSFQIDLSYRKRESVAFSSFSGGSFTGNTRIGTLIASPQFLIQRPVLGFQNNLTFGFDYVKAEEDIVNDLLFLGEPSTGIFTLEKENYGFYVHDEFHPSDRVGLSGGYRRDQVKYRFTPSDPAGTDFDEDLLTLGVNFNFYRDSYVYASYSRGFRYPVLDEIFNFQSNTIDAGLLPQTSDDYELGIRHNFAPDFHLGISFFRVDTDKEIFFNPAGGPFGFGANENLDGKTRKEGVEIALGKKFARTDVRASYTYIDAEIRSGQFSGKAVPSVPKHKVALDAAYSPMDPLKIAGNLTYVGKRFLESDFANDFSKLDEYVVFNLKLSYTFRKFTLYTDLNNIFDKEYSEFGVLSLGFPAEPAFFPSPERNLFVGLRYDY